MKIFEITNVDFSLRHFLLPLMRAARDRGHEVIGICAEGPLLDDIRAEGFRIVGVPFERSLSPVAHIRAFRALVALMRAERMSDFFCNIFLNVLELGSWPSKRASQPRSKTRKATIKPTSAINPARNAIKGSTC